MIEAAVVVAVWLFLNVLMTRRVLAASKRVYLPARMLIATIWLLPFIGAFAAFGHTPAGRVVDRIHEMNDRRDRSAEYGEPPATVACGTAAVPGAQPFAMADHLQWSGGLPILDWAALDEWARTTAATGDEAARLIESGRHAWLLHLRAALGAHMGIHETPNTYLLSSLDPQLEKATADFVGTARTRIQRLLGDLARFPAGQRSILLVLDDEDEYYQYVSSYYPDGEFATSGGMFIDSGCPHFVVTRGHLQQLEPVIAHELTHSAVAHLRLPRWLDEGIAVNSERKVAGPQGSLYTPHELHAMHRRHWNEQQIQNFWSGQSFLQPDDGTLLSYELARIIVEQMARQWDAFANFVRAAAGAEDAGAEAARTALQIDLGAYAAVLMETEPTPAWTPARSALPQA